MSDQRDGNKLKDGIKPKDGVKPGDEAATQKVDEAVQENAGQERANNEGYD